MALPLAIAGTGQMVGSYSAASVANSRYRAALVAAATAAGGVCGFLFFTANLGKQQVPCGVGRCRHGSRGSLRFLFFTANLGLWASVALATAATGFLSVTFPVLVAASTEYSGESKATGVGLMGFSNQGGGVLGAGIAGVLLASTGYGGIGYMCLGVTIVSALLTSLFGRQFGESAGQSKG